MLPMTIIGTPELLVVLVVVVLLFGVRKLPEMGKGLAEGINAFRKALNLDNHKELDGKTDKPEASKEQK